MLKNIITLVIAATVAANASLVARADEAAGVSAASATLKGNNISASFKFTESKKDSNQLGVELRVKGLKPGVAYPYHIHVSPVPANGNCTSTGGHLDPAKVKVADKPYNCDSKNAATTCELGDLAGRHGNITADASGEFTVKYTDSLISFSGANTILGHSVVIHAPDNSRLACANITTLKKGAEASSSEIESVASASALESAPAHSSKGSESDSANASIATGVESKKGSTASTAVVSGLAALIAAAFAL